MRAAEFFESADLTTATGELSFDDAWLIAQHIEVSDADIDEWLPAERYEELLPESAADIAANAQRVIESVERIEVHRRTCLPDSRIMFMNAKDRMKLALKGDREARSILIRDSNKGRLLSGNEEPAYHRTGD